MEFQIAENIGTMKKPRIMIVEDNISLIMLMEEVLTDFEYFICNSVTSGEAAIRNIQHEKPDIVLMDIDLNGKMNGIEAATKIRYLYNLPIIFLTGHIDKETKEQAKAVEPAGYFIKPVKFEDLKLTINKIILSKSLFKKVDM